MIPVTVYELSVKTLEAEGTETSRQKYGLGSGEQPGDLTKPEWLSYLSKTNRRFPPTILTYSYHRNESFVLKKKKYIYIN